MDPNPTRSWKERLLGKNPCDLRRKTDASDFDEENDFAFVEGDIMRSFFNGIPSINLSKRINQLLIKDMAYIVVIKLLGKSIEYAALQNKIYALSAL